MKFFNILSNFRNDEDGAVTVDWVVLTAAIVGLGIAVLTTVGGGINELSGDIAEDVSSTAVGGVVAAQKAE
ncbi:pilus assembly protein [Pacificitalea manganoxidans]|uniref:Pilus assembly protein n=1 Tax=Pacificitalea manganoxidans TaxID=1411902 RepID=A0A291LXS6_9RHOB|nr:pilus assembly protein [Pacificitalea manganoxidans]ATI41492.1 pilus assembly protein [Pacificitalea manganoxidans]MDR6308912.1 Flp pilus assembly pilin Flp [Pacificitalea manganoxidans]